MWQLMFQNPHRKIQSILGFQVAKSEFYIWLKVADIYIRFLWLGFLDQIFSQWNEISDILCFLQCQIANISYGQFLRWEIFEISDISDSGYLSWHIYQLEDISDDGYLRWHSRECLAWAHGAGRVQPVLLVIYDFMQILIFNHFDFWSALALIFDFLCLVQTSQ